MAGKGVEGFQTTGTLCTGYVSEGRTTTLTAPSNGFLYTAFFAHWYQWGWVANNTSCSNTGGGGKGHTLCP